MIKKFLKTQSTSLFRYIIEQLILGLFDWVPSLIGIFLRSFFYRIIIHSSVSTVFEKNIIIKQAKNITLGKYVFIDTNVYLHATQNGIKIGNFTRVMHNAELNVANFRNLKESKINIGNNCVIGPSSVIFGQFGVDIGDNVIIAPRVSILPINHFYQDKNKLIAEQGIYGKGIKICNNVWIGAHAAILDGVTINEGAVIAAGSIVKDNIPPFSLVAGVPAKIIKQW